MFLLNELFQAYPLDSAELLDNQDTEDTVQKVVKKTGQRQQILLPLHLLHQSQLGPLALVGLDRFLHGMTWIKMRRDKREKEDSRGRGGDDNNDTH